MKERDTWDITTLLGAVWLCVTLETGQRLSSAVSIMFRAHSLQDTVTTYVYTSGDLLCRQTNTKKRKISSPFLKPVKR